MHSSQAVAAMNFCGSSPRRCLTLASWCSRTRQVRSYGGQREGRGTCDICAHLLNVLVAPGLSDEFQQRTFREVRKFFEADEELKLTADIRLSPYYRGWSELQTGEEPTHQCPRGQKFCQPITFFAACTSAC